MWGTLLLILAIVNVSIYSSEQILEKVQPVLLEIAPRDPRSLIQGDYLRLRYEMANIVH